jgi:mannosyltransferase OCH1-like enzyme
MNGSRMRAPVELPIHHTPCAMTIKDFIFPALNSQPGPSVIASFPAGGSIPRIIHQTYFTKTLPEVIAKNTQMIRDMNPGWDYRLYDDNDIAAFISSNYGPHVLNSFNSISDSYGAAKADLFRYLLLYKYGGVYFDIKATLDKPLEMAILEDDQFLLSYWADENTPQYQGWGMHSDLKDHHYGELQQWHIACAPGHPFLKAVIDAVLSNLERYDPYLHGVGKMGVLRVTGPIAFTLAIAPIIHLHGHRIIKSYSDAGFVYSLFEKTDDHGKLFAKHYLQQKDSVVNQSLYRKGKTLLTRILRKLLKLLKK